MVQTDDCIYVCACVCVCVCVDATFKATAGFQDANHIF